MRINTFLGVSAAFYRCAVDYYSDKPGLLEIEKLGF